MGRFLFRDIPVARGPEESLSWGFSVLIDQRHLQNSTGPRVQPMASSEQHVLGYINFSSGAPDPAFHSHLNRLFDQQGGAGRPTGAVWQKVALRLRAELNRLRSSSSAFADTRQAEGVLGLVFDELIPSYREYHQDLLGHQSDDLLFNSFFLARAAESVLQHAGPFEEQSPGSSTTPSDELEPERQPETEQGPSRQRPPAVEAPLDAKSEPERQTGGSSSRVLGVLQALNDYVGYRPVAVLHNGRRTQPYQHERIRPVPLFINGAGVASGPYQTLLGRALQILGEANPDLLEQAEFSLDVLDELALDPRAYDFGHPVNRRPNYQFGEWDPDVIDNKGRYRRFVIRQVTADALLSRIQEEPHLPPDELIQEAAAVLAGVILMASGTSGAGPGRHDSTVNLAKLVPRVAKYRDQFYADLLERTPGPHGDRLRQEAATTRQPFGGARQHLNRHLARLRATQLQHIELARLFAEMGHPQASLRQAASVPVARGRMMAEIACRVTLAHQDLDAGRLDRVVQRIPEAEELLQRAIRCGAFVDPWNVLGFAGQFALFSALENSVQDPRVEELLDVVDGILTLMVRTVSEAAATGRDDLIAPVGERLKRLGEWWDQFATTSVSSISHVSGEDSYDSAMHLSDVLGRWYRAGASAGDSVFWREQLDRFRAPKGYALVIEALLNKQDYPSALGLLMQWLGQADSVPLEEESFSFYLHALRWMQRSGPSRLFRHVNQPQRPAIDSPQADPAAAESDQAAAESDQAAAETRQQQSSQEQSSDEATEHTSQDAQEDSSRSTESILPEKSPDPGSSGQLAPTPSRHPWELVRKFFDFLEVSAEQYWDVPQLSVSSPAAKPSADDLLATGGGEEQDVAELSEEENPFSAAYEGMTYRDSTGDGHEGETLEAGPEPADADEWMSLAQSVGKRLRFLTNLAELWRIAVGTHLDLTGTDPEIPGPHNDRHNWQADVLGWLDRAASNRQELLRLLGEVTQHPLAQPIGGGESLLEDDRRRRIQQGLADDVLAACVATDRAAVALLGSLPRATAEGTDHWQQLPLWQQQAIRLERAAQGCQLAEVEAALPDLFSSLQDQPLLYVPLAKGGDPDKLLVAQRLQQVFRGLLKLLPRLGLFDATYELVEFARTMEKRHPVGPRAVTEFDRLFQLGFQGLVERLIDGAKMMLEGPFPATPRSAETTPGFSKSDSLESDSVESGPVESGPVESGPVESGVSEVGRQQSGRRRIGRSDPVPRPGPIGCQVDDEVVELLQKLTDTFLKVWLQHSQSVRLSVLERIADEAHWQRIVTLIRGYGKDLFVPQFLNLGNLRTVLHRGLPEYIQTLEEDDEEDLPKIISDLGRSIPRQQTLADLELILEAIAENYEHYKDYNSTTTQSDSGDNIYMLLDFLRLKAGYDRVAWHLRPLALAHEVLVRQRQLSAAEQWRRVVEDKTTSAASWHLERLNRLESEHGMQLPTVGDTIREKFLRPFHLDRIRALVRPAVAEGRSGQSGSALDALEEELQEFVRTPTGAGLDMPHWLVTLSHEVREARRQVNPALHALEWAPELPQIRLSLIEIRKRLENWTPPDPTERTY